ncbi:hypothetical protein Fmac_017967 [Flemingia macrophylla]|uniref:Uncharacterized protein n=1 Tax=Flemingia macrophylla TaxID=520843 RepID=A0ABD1M3N5_9FABA
MSSIPHAQLPKQQSHFSPAQTKCCPHHLREIKENNIRLRVLPTHWKKQLEFL